MDKSTAAAKLNIPEADILSVSINWTAPGACIVIMLGDKANVTKWFYTVTLQNGHVLVLMEEPPVKEIMEYIKANHPIQEKYAKL
jgi:hypothetical protein